ncbi:hypothetical protein C2845_PM08G25730 [Panicum miliaceum]|uniref:Uncharacterized protein n=1 Tax=Panicum miliaceum TaxID=4540 RepID=A0A3L6QXC8_PANMI|nr:hypothetical protein C2845_PM08G25730 [Panicum miliaceum]
MMLPLVKLGSLAFRTLSKPIAARLKHNAGIHPKFRGFIIGIAQFPFAVEKLAVTAVFVESRKLGLLDPFFFFSTPSSDGNSGLNIEMLFSASEENFHHEVAGAAIIYEVQRSARSDARKEEVRKQEMEAIKKREEQLAIEVQLLKQKISEMERKYSKWILLPGFRGFGTAQAAAQPAGTQQPTAA